jgi:spore coat protein U-like protein
MKYTSALHSAARATLLGFLALGLTTTSAFAATATTTFNVTATIANICSVTATNLAFGTVPATGAQNTSTITVTCTPGDSYSVALTAGDSGAEGARYMKGTGAHQLPYALTETSYSGANWGTTAGAVAGTGNGAAQPLTVYGTITAAQALAAPVDATYSDTITVNVTY